MTRLRGCAAVVLGGLCAGLLDRTHAHAQQTAPLAGARVDQVCLVVPDVDRTTVALTAILGIEPIPPRLYEHEAPTRKGKLRISFFRFPHAEFNFEIIQVADGTSTFHDFAKQHREGVQHIDFKVPDGMTERVGQLQQRAPLTGGRQGETTYALLDFTHLGATFEITQGPPPTLPPSPVDLPIPLGRLKPVGIGIVVRNVDATAREYADLLGVAVPAASVQKSRVASDPKSQAKIVTIPTGGLALELIEPMGGQNMWTDFVSQRGFVVHHVTFDAGRHMDAIAGDLLAKGGRAIPVDDALPYRYVDFLSQFHLVFELRREQGR